MIRFYCLLTGDRYQDLLDHTAASRKKCMALAGGVILVTLVWALVGYCLASNVLGLSRGMAILTSMVMALIIFLVDRSIILANTSNMKFALARIALALMSAYLGGIALEQTLFDKDIRQQIAENRQQLVQREEKRMDDGFKQQDEILLQERQDAEAKEAVAITALNDELNGAPNSTGTRGYGNVAKVKEAQVNNAQAERAQNTNAREKLKAEHEARRNARLAEITSSWQENALLERMEALHQFLGAHPTVLYFMFLPLLLFMVLLELLPLMLKRYSSNTAYEVEIAAVEELRMERARGALLHYRRATRHGADLTFDELRAEELLRSGASSLGRAGVANGSKGRYRAEVSPN